MVLVPLLLLCAAPSVSGSVVDTDGDPVPAAVVELREALIFDGPARDKNVAHAVTDAAGRFTATPGFKAKLARATASGYAQTGAIALDEWVAVGDAAKVTLTLRKQKVGTVTGSVVDEANAPIVGAMVGPVNGDRQSSVFTDASGAFSLSVASGELDVYRRGYVRQRVKLTSAPLKIIMPRRPSIAVYLFEGAGQPMHQGQTVEAFRADGSRISSCNTRPTLGDCTLEAELGEVTVTATVGGKTVKQVLRLESSTKVDVSLRF